MIAIRPSKVNDDLHPRLVAGLRQRGVHPPQRPVGYVRVDGLQAAAQAILDVGADQPEGPRQQVEADVKRIVLHSEDG